ncbi:HdeD family acid-resistance protein [Acaryochloris sp. IP29b_bin.148]|uniref:HdeD family acid-resistance protein n=1 Tax=Acaryochloris sp. IP29b_bin.148 TaxID=2969218 RepID=UPI002608ABFA|nr:HdeD family acid-resistance protein [Acaryochloris sp. IP29b_bin.148]
MSNQDIQNNQPSFGKWSIALGALIVVLGFVAIAMPFVSTLATELVIAGVFLSSGIIQLIYAYQSRANVKSLAFKFLLGAGYIGSSLLLLFYPLQGVLTLTLAVGSFLLVEGILQAVMAIRMREEESGWYWTLGSGVFAVVFGLSIMLGWPADSAWILGLLVGLNLISDGWPMVIFGLVDTDLFGPGPQQPQAS